jgi:hypothetical protein
MTFLKSLICKQQLFRFNFFTNFFPCLIRQLKFSEIYRVTGAMGVVRGSFPHVKKGCVFSPLLDQISNNKQ